MSRCFPYQRPGFGNIIQYNENDLSEKEKKKGKKKKKEKNSNKEGKEKKERNHKDEGKSKQPKKKDKGRDTNTGVEEKNCFVGRRVQEAEVDSGDTEFQNGLIVADTHNRGWNDFSREVRKNPRDSNIIRPGSHGINQHYYNSGDTASINSLHPISKNATRFVKESTTEVYNGGTEFPNGLIVADNRGWNGFSREVRQNPRDSNTIPPGAYLSNQYYYNSMDKVGMNSVRPISKTATRFVKESTNNIRGSAERSGGHHPNSRNGFRNGEHLAPNHLHLPTKTGRGNVREPEWHDRCTNSSEGENARSFGYCNGDGPIHNHDRFTTENKNQRHMHELDMKRRPFSKPVSVIMDRSSSSPVMAQSNPPPRVDRRDRPTTYRFSETRNPFPGPQNNIPKSSFTIPVNREPSDQRGRAEIPQIHADDEAVKPVRDEMSAKLDGISIPGGDGVGGGGKRKREGGKQQMSKEEKARNKAEKHTRKEARAKRREMKAKRKEEKSRSIVVYEFQKMQSCAEQSQQPPLQMEVDSLPIVQIRPQSEDLCLTGILNVVGFPSVPEAEAKRKKHGSAAANSHGSGVIKEDDSGSVSVEKAKHSDGDRLLYQFPPIPEIRQLVPPVEDQDWLFNGSSRRQNENQKSPLRGVEVWAETLRIESADTFALPYVIPY